MYNLKKKKKEKPKPLPPNFEDAIRDYQKTKKNIKEKVFEASEDKKKKKKKN